MIWIRLSESGSFEGQAMARAADLLLRDVCLSWLWWLNKSWVWLAGRSDGCYNDKTPFPLPLFDFVILNCRCSDFNARDDEFRPPPFISTPFPSSLTAGLSAIQDCVTKKSVPSSKVFNDISENLFCLGLPSEAKRL